MLFFSSLTFTRVEKVGLYIPVRLAYRVIQAAARTLYGAIVVQKKTNSIKVNEEINDRKIKDLFLPILLK